MKKILSLLLVGVMVFSMIPAAYATNVVTNESEGNATTAVTYTANDEANEEWRLTVPASMEANSSAYVVLEGTWASNKTLNVTADESVDMVSQIDGKTTKTIAITFDSIELAGDNDAAVSNKTTENPNGAAISIAAMPADALFGEWAGTFEYYVEFVKEETATLITFTISDDCNWTNQVTYQAEEGMTWQDWVGSKYDTDNRLQIAERKSPGGPLVNYVWMDEPEDYTSAERALYWDLTAQKADTVIQSGYNYHKGTSND